VNIVEPNFGLPEQLDREAVLTVSELDYVCNEITVKGRNGAILDLLVTEDKCSKFLKALQQSGQQHVVNFITQNGGEKN